MTNGITSPHHTGAPELGNGNGLRLGLTALTSLLVERERAAAVIDPHTANLVKQYGLDLEKIDQKLLELGPYAQDAYPEGQLSVTEDLPVVSPVDLKKGKRMKLLAQGRMPRRLSRVGEDFVDSQRGGWREVGEAKQEENMEKDVPKKKWRKVGSAGPLVRGKEGQLDAESDPLNVSSACVIQPASEIEMRALYLPTQSEFGTTECTKNNSSASKVADVEHQATPTQSTSKQVPASATNKPSEPPLEVDRTSPVHALPSHPTSTSVATPAPSTPDCNTSTPSETPNLPRTQPSAQWIPHTAKFSPGSRQDILATTLGHHPQQVSVESAGASEEVDVTRVENTESQSHQLTATQAERVQLLSSDFQALQKGYASSNHPHSRKDFPVSKSISPPTLAEVLTVSREAHRTSSPSAVNPSHRLLETNHISEALTQPLGAGSIIRPPGFSIAQLTWGPDTSAMSPTHEVYSPQDHTRGGSIQVGGERIVLPPYEVENSLRKRRSSSSSSHRSMKHHFEDSSSVRSASPLSTSTSRNQHMPVLIRGEWMDGGTCTPPPTQASQEIKPPAPQASPVPFPMWPNMPQMPNDNSLPGQPQRFPVQSPFLAASGPWFRTGMLPGMSFRPGLYPTAAAAAANPLDPNNPYKSMLSMPYYSFTPAGLKAPFPNSSFTTSSPVAQGSQPQTPSSVPPTQGFTFGQYPIPTGPGVTALRGMTDAQSCLSAATPPLGQHPSLDSKLTSGSSDSPQDQQPQQQQQPWPLLHGMQLFQGPFGFGMQSPLASSVNQSSLLAARGAMALSSPLTLANQSVVFASAGERDSAAVKRPQNQSVSTIDLTTHGDYAPKHIEAPSPQEAVKMATQKISPFHEQLREAPKWRGIQEAMQAPSSSSSPLVPAFINNLAVSSGSSSQVQGPVMSYSMLGAPGTGATPMNLQGHLLNPSQLVGVALPGGHMFPMGYTQALSSFSTKIEEGGKKRSPKGSGSQKLRIHQMDFKSQGKVDRRRRRPWRATEKDRKEEDLNASALEDLNASALDSSKTKPAGESPIAVENPALPAHSEDNYALNMLADCSSKEGEKTTSGEETSTSGQKQELVAKRAHMRSPGSLAGANSLLLLAKPDPPALPTTLPLRVTPPETAVVDGLLRLSNSSLPNSSSAPQDAALALLPTMGNIAENSEEETVPDSRGRLNSMSAAEAILMIGQCGAKAEEIKREVPSNEEAPTTQKIVLSADTSTKDQAAKDEKNEVGSEKRDTDSEATLSPTSPSPSAGSQWSQGAPYPHALTEEGSPQGLSAQTPDVLGQVCPKMVTTSLGASPSSSPLTSQTSDCKEIVGSQSGVVALPQTTDKNSQEIPENRGEAFGQRPENPQLEDATVKKWNSDVNASQFVRGDVTESDVVSTVRREGLLGVGSFPTTISPAKEEESYDLDVEEVETESTDTLKPNDSSTGVTVSSQQEAQEYSSSDRSLPPKESAREDVVLGAPSPHLQLLVVAPVGVESTMQSEREELLGETAQEEIEGEGQLLSVDLIPPTKRAKVEEPSYQPPPEEEMDINTTSALQSPVRETGVDPSLPEPASPPSSDLPSGNAEFSASQIAPDTPSPIDLKHPERDATPEKLETSPVMECNSQDDPIQERSGSYPVEPLSPAGFTEDCISGAPDGKETQPESQGTSSEVREQECNPSSGAGDPVSPNIASTTPKEDSPQPAPLNIPNHRDVADISWPSDSEEGEDKTTEIGAVLSQKDEGAISITAPKSPPTAAEHISLSDGSLQPATLKVTSKSPPFSTSSEKHSSPRAVNRKSPRPSTVEPSTGTSAANPVNSVRKPSPPVAPQNRLPIGKSGFDRHQHRKVLSQHSQKQHSREEITTQTKKWSRGLESPSRPWNLFDVDPQDARRQPKTENREQNDHSEVLSQGRKTKLTSRPPISSHGLHSHAGNKLSTERSKHGSRSPRSFGSEESSHRHNRLQEGRGHVWESREKQKVRPAGRQGSRFSPLPPSHVELSPGSPLVSDEEQSRIGRGKVHQNSHGLRDDHQSQTDHGRDRTHTQSKHKSSHRGDSKQGTDHAGRKVVRVEKEKSHGPTEQRKAPPASLESNHSDGGSVSGGYRRHRDEDDHSSSRLKVATIRKRSYESVSDDELPEELNRSSSRESSLLREEGARLERRSSLEGAGEQRSSQWRKDRRRSADPSDEGEDYTMTVKHKKHRHSKDHKEHRERRKWRKADGSDLKLKRSSEEKPWHSCYHKH